MLKRGGNAVDAAVAAALTLGVVQPAFSGLGGGGFALVHLAKTGEDLIIDYRETAPGRSSAEMFKVGGDGEVANGENRIGFKAVAVSGTVAGLSLALERGGTMTLPEVARDAIGYANTGFETSPLLSSIIRSGTDSTSVKLSANREMRRLLLKADKSVYEPGEKMILPDLGRTMERISQNGIQEFYEGFVAESITQDMAQNGGLIGKDDLRAYEPRLRVPVTAEYKGLKIFTMSPPSSGGIALIQLLKMLEHRGLRDTGVNTPATIDVMSRALAAVYPARERVADPDFADVDVDELISDRFIEGLRDQSWGERSTGPARDRLESQTTHLCVIDRERNAVALTESLECFFGAGVVVPGAGILLNDTMHDFDPRPGEINSVQPGKTPLSSMAPTIFMRDDTPFLVLGSAAGPRIITAVLQVALNVIDHGMNVQDAIAAPRFHFQGGRENRLAVEGRIEEPTRDELKKLGYRIDVRDDFDLYFGGVHAIVVDGDELHGGADPRRDGVALAY